MYKIGIIGDRESVLAFRALGLEVFPCDTAKEASKFLNQMAGDEYAIIYVTENLAENLKDDIDKYGDSKLPAIIPIPNRSGATGKGMYNVKKAVERAVGADILFGGDK